MSTTKKSKRSKSSAGLPAGVKKKRSAAQEVAALIRGLRKWLDHDKYRAAIPAVEKTLHSALWDAQRLDDMASKQGMKTFYHSDLIASLKCKGESWTQLFLVATIPVNKRLWKALRKEWGKWERVSGALIARDFRKHLRDGAPPEFAMQLMLPGLAKELRNGNLAPLLDIADAIRKHTRSPLVWSLEELSRRAWLPLRLWECYRDKSESLQRIGRAHEIMAKAGITVPQLPRGDGILKVLNEVKRTVTHRARL